MNVTLIGTLVFLMLLVISVVWALIRGVTKARIRFVCVLLCAAGALLLTLAVRNKLEDLYLKFEPQIQEFLVSNGQEDLWNFINGSETTREAVEASGGAILAPIVFLLVFLVLQLATWILYFIVTLILHGAIRRREEKRHFRLIRAPFWGLLQFVVILFVFLAPVFCYLQFAPTLVKAANDAGVMPAQAQETVSVENAEKAKESPVMKFYGKFGGDKLNKALTKMTVQGETTYLADEIGSLAGMTGDVVTLKNAGSVENWTSKEADAIQSLADSLGDSKLVSALLGDLLKQATDKWLANEPFLGMAKPSMGEYMDPFLVILLEDLGKDARSITAVSNDLKTVGKLLSVLIRDGILTNLNDTDALVSQLTKGTTVKDMIDILNGNATLSNLIPEFTKIGMKAVGNMLNDIVDSLPENYEEFFDEVTDKLNEVLESVDLSSLDKDSEEYEAKKAELTEKLQDQLDQAGVDVELSDDIVGIYADTILDEFKNSDGTVTVDQLKEMFGIELPSSATAE